MDAALIVRVLARRRHLRAHERWSSAQLTAYRDGALADLRRRAYQQSAFYRRFHHGLEHRPLADLPVLTKAGLMGSFDELVTDPGVKLAAVTRHLESLCDDEPFLGRYRVVRTSGTTGQPGIFLADDDEWVSIIASYSRAQEWAGVAPTLTRRTRLAVVSSVVPWHQSARVGRSVDSPFIPVRRFDATQPLAEVVAGLNAWQPENLIAYASMGSVLASEQLAGRLHIAPRAVMCSSEVLTSEAARLIERAFGAAPFNVYAATETAGIASACSRRRMHLYEDLVIVEVADERNRPVPVGVPGAKLLVTVLFSRTQPLIRYEMSDQIQLTAERCDCGLPFGLVGAIEGRTEDVLHLPSATGATVDVHPNVFHRLLEALPVKEWQVVQTAEALRVLLVGVAGPLDRDALAAAVTRDLSAAGALAPLVRVELVEKVERTAIGKAPLVVALRRPPSAGGRTGMVSVTP